MEFTFAPCSSKPRYLAIVILNGHVEIFLTSPSISIE